MAIKKIKLRNFRNYHALQLEIKSGITIFTGKNGIGKTSVLEAVALLGSSRSFRTARNKDFIQHKFESSEISGEISDQGLETNIKITIHPMGKRVYLNEKLSKSAEPLFQLLPSIVFSPGDHKIIEGDASDRRNFLNRAASHIDWTYADDLSHYNRTLLHRNKLLQKAKEERLSLSQLENLIEVWDSQVVDYGSRLIIQRNKYLSQLGEKAEEEYEKISHSGDRFELKYLPFNEENLPIEGLEQVQEIFKKKLKETARHDLYTGSSHYGPHKDEILLTLNGNKVKFYGSQGEKRTCALALRLGELALFHYRWGKFPILLFDDVSSELDQSRRHSLVKLLKQERAQVIITATELPSSLMNDVNRSFEHLELTSLGERNS